MRSQVSEMAPADDATRIVMLTDDLQIDRRIVQEALSLTKAGFQVVVLAPAVDGGAAPQVAEPVRIERLPPAQFPGVVAVQNVHRKFIEAINTMSAGLQSGCGRVLTAGTAMVSAGGRLAGLGGVGRIGWRGAARGLGIAQKLALRALWLAAVAANKGSVLAQRLAARTAGLSNREQAFLEALERRGADVIHAHDLPQLRVAAQASRRLRVPLVYDAHEFYPEIHTLTAQQKKMLARREHRYLRDCDAVITVNPYIAAEMAARYGIAVPNVILNAVDPPAAQPEAAEARSIKRVLGLADSQRIALYQGWLAPGRGLESLVRAGARIPDGIHIVLMGYGVFKEELRELARESGDRANVHFLDAVPQHELIYWTRSADVGLIPYQPVDFNNRHCSPNKLFEFIQAGVPIIANDLPFLRDVIDGEGIGMTTHLESPEDFARALSAFFASDARVYRDRLRQVAHKYSWAEQEDRLLSIYHDLVQE